MQRTRSQVLFRFLPGSVFPHEDGFVAQSVATDMNVADSIVNKRVLLDELSTHLDNWPAQRITGIPRPNLVPDSEFVLIEPTRINWEVWPLLFTCTNGTCLRARNFRDSRQALRAANSAHGLKCMACGSRLQQLRYFAAHACGRIVAMHMPKCRLCGSYDHIYLEDTGSFETSSWRCRACGNAYVRGTRFTPCQCGTEYRRPGQKVTFMRSYGIRDPQTWYPQSINLINLRSRDYDTLQSHPQRGVASIASFIGDEARVQDALDELDRSQGGSQRLTAEEWTTKENNLRAAGLADDDIDVLRRTQAPLESGPATLRGLSPEIIAIGESRSLLERSVLFDPVISSGRRTLEAAAAEEHAQGRVSIALALADAASRAAALGISELSVTLEFPILLATYGYTRTSRTPGSSTLRGFAAKNRYEGKTPIFVSSSSTEAIYVVMSARAVLEFLHSRGEVAEPSAEDERSARLQVLDLFANDPLAASTVRTLVHSMSHAMLRSLDDGQTGFGESSLAEWVVPESLTFAIYVSGHQSYTLGALWTLMHTRSRAWMDRVVASVWRCDNDPLCHHRTPCACERCMFLTFGCQAFNGDLSRRLLMEFWRHRSVGTTVI